MKISNKLFNDQLLISFPRIWKTFKRFRIRFHLEKYNFASDDPVGAVQLSGMKDNPSR